MIKRLIVVSILSIAAISAGLSALSIKTFTLLGWLLYSAEIFAGITVFVIGFISILLGYFWVFDADEDESFLTFSKNFIESLKD